MLTPDERRGALMVLGLVLIGALWDGSGRWRGQAPRGEIPAGARETSASWPGEVAPARPLTAPADSAAPGARPAAAVPAPLDLNLATAPELEALPGIGPVLARRILEHRRRFGPFRSPEELRAVRGVGPRLMARLAGRVRAGP